MSTSQPIPPNPVSSTIEPSPPVVIHDPNDFTVTRVSHGIAQNTFVVRRHNPSTPWPSTQALLKICDDGWASYFANQPACHFGGVVEPMSSREVFVTVYID